MKKIMKKSLLYKSNVEYANFCRAKALLLKSVLLLKYPPRLPFFTQFTWGRQRQRNGYKAKFIPERVFIG